jgi:2,3-bisphosphoglycerate-dependent phosphoglycerate mutase
MQFYFFRHAQSTNNKLWSETRSDEGRDEDPGLTDMGEQQAAALAELLIQGSPEGGRICDNTSGNEGSRGFNLTHIYSSLMVRSVKTGMIAARRLGLVLHGLDDIHERGGIYLRNHSNGEDKCLPGKSSDYFKRYFPDFVLPQGFIEDGWWNSRPVETPEKCLIRAEGFLDYLLDKHGGTEDRVAIISHGGFYNDFMAVLLGLPHNGNHWFSMYNTGITRINFHENEKIVVYQNRVEHLHRNLLT